LKAFATEDWETWLDMKTIDPELKLTNSGMFQASRISARDKRIAITHIFGKAYARFTQEPCDYVRTYVICTYVFRERQRRILLTYHEFIF